jgi:hypothetical protein
MKSDMKNRLGQHRDKERMESADQLAEQLFFYIPIFNEKTWKFCIHI